MSCKLHFLKYLFTYMANLNPWISPYFESGLFRFTKKIPIFTELTLTRRIIFKHKPRAGNFFKNFAFNENNPRPRGVAFKSRFIFWIIGFFKFYYMCFI